MINPQIRERARNLIHADRRERRRPLQQRVARTISDVAAHGSVQSGRTVHAVMQPMIDELKARANLTFNTLVRVHNALGSPLTDNLAEDLKHEFSIYIDEDARELTDELRKALPWAPPDRLTLQDEHINARDKVHAEIDLYVDSLKVRPTSAPEAGSQTVINVTGPVGAVQTGHGATAHVVQHLASDDKKELLAALALLRESLIASPELSSDIRDELSVLVGDSETELKKDKPVIARIRAVLFSVATTIQTVASMQPAYQALKIALVPLGVMLP